MKLKICVSDRCFFPRSALMSSKAIVKLAQDLGYEQVEFHPTWAIWWEVFTKGKLSCREADISSFHINWREDRRNAGQGFLKRNFFVGSSWPFVFESGGVWALKKLEEKYKKPVVIHWQEDFDLYQKGILELHALLKLGLKQLEQEIAKGTIKGVIIDTDKFTGWLKRNGGKEDQSLERLFPFIRGVHFRFRHQKDFRAVSGRKDAETTRLIKKIIMMGYQGQVVVELGWPDPESVEVLRRKGAKEVHQRIVKFLRSL